MCLITVTKSLHRYLNITDAALFILFFKEIKDGFAINYSESKQKVLFQDIRFIDYTVRKPNVLYSYRLELNTLNMH